MKKLFFTFLIVLVASFSVSAQADLSVFFNKSDAFFKKHVKEGRVAYKEIKNNNTELETLYKIVESANLSSASELERKAFYINAYNLLVIYQVVKYYPLKSPLNKSGFFNMVKHTVAGESMALNALEIKKLILHYNDPTIHFALACAAVSCPPLASFGYRPQLLEKQLAERTRLSINDPEWLQIEAGQKKILLSKIFEWYKKDFSMDGQNSVLEFINKYRKDKIPTNYQLDYYEYDWNLNEG